MATLAGGVIDVAETTERLEAAKLRVRAAIAREVQRAGEAHLVAAYPILLQMRQDMVAPLHGLHRFGRSSARKEMRALGVEPRRAFATTVDPQGYPERLRSTLVRMQVGLDDLGLDIQGRMAEAALSAGSPFDPDVDPVAAMRDVLGDAPGALDLSGQLVSQSYTSGLADVYEMNADAFGGWAYSAALDGGTCEECLSRSGETYATLAEGYAVLPEFGPNPFCRGGYRCRCRLEPLGPQARPSGLAPEGAGGEYVPARYEMEPLDYIRGPGADDYARWRERGVGRLNDARGEDVMLHDIARVQGFDGLPALVDQAELDRVVAEGGVKLWRGLTMSHGDDYGRQFQTGDYFAGRGVAGDGTYTARDLMGTASAKSGTTAGRDIARDYASEGDRGQVLQMVLRPNARTITFRDAVARMEKDRDFIEADLSLGDSKARDDLTLAFYSDPGRWAAAQGYDAIISGKNYVVVLNRRAVKVLRDIEEFS